MSTNTITPATASRLVTEAGTDADKIQNLHKRIGGSYAAGTDGWSIVVSRYTRAAQVAEVYGDKRAKDSTARMSTKDYADGFGVTGPMVARWARAGWALEVGVEEGTVKMYLRKPNAYDPKVIDEALREGKRDAMALGEAAKTKAKADAAAERKAAKDAARESAGEPTVETKDGKTTVVAVDVITVITAALTAMTGADVDTYIGTHGTDAAEDLAGSLALAAEVVRARVAETIGAEVADMEDVDAVA